MPNPTQEKKKEVIGWATMLPGLEMPLGLHHTRKEAHNSIQKLGSKKEIQIIKVRITPVSKKK